MPRRPKTLADQFLEPPELNTLFEQYAKTHTLEQTICYLDGLIAVFGIVDEMLYAKMKDGSRWHETQERAFQQIDHFVFEKRELLDRLIAEYDPLRKPDNPSPQKSDATLKL